VTELEIEFEKLGNEKAQQQRFMRSQQDLKTKMEEAAANAGDQDGDGRYKFNTLVTMEIYYTTSFLQMVDNQMNNIFVYNATFNYCFVIL
jgi:hypothetical protein